MTEPTRQRKIVVGTVFIAVIVGIGWFLDWNEYRSPWGRDVQAAKIEHLKKTLCDQ